MLRRFFPSSSDPRRQATGAARSRKVPFRLWCEPLEEREVPSVTLAAISDQQIANDKPTYLPVTVTNTPSGPVTTTVTSSTSNVAASVVQGGESVRFDVTGTDSNGVAFSGSMTVLLFTDSAPNAAQRIIDLVNSGYYNGKLFPRVVNDFVIQGGGSSTADNSSLPPFETEINSNYQFNSPGLLAMANASSSDSNNSQFFITDTNLPLTGGTANIETNLEAQLNDKYSIVGILTSGFDIYQKIITTTVTAQADGGEDSSPTEPITITSATVFKDTSDAVIELTPTPGFTGTANITVTANDGSATPATAPFTVTGTADATNGPPFIGALTNQTTTEGTPVSFQVPVTDPSGVTTTIAIRNSDPGQKDDFTTSPTNATVSINQTTDEATVTPVAGFTGTIQLEVGVRPTADADVLSSYDTQIITLTVNPASASTTSPPPATNTFTAVGSAPGTTPEVVIKNSDGSVAFTVPVFDPSFTGGVNVAIGDVTGAGSQAVLATPGYGGGPIMLVIDPATGKITDTVTMFNPAFRGGINLQVGDIAGLGYDQVLVGAGPSGGPRVMLLNLVTDTVMLNFFAGNSTARGGTSVALGTLVKNDGEMIVAGSGPGTTPTVSVYDASANPLGSFPVTSSGATTETGVSVQVGSPNATTGNSLIYAAPLNSPIGASETSYDPTKYITFSSSDNSSSS